MPSFLIYFYDNSYFLKYFYLKIYWDNFFLFLKNNMKILKIFNLK
jgi:hypothetical protein